MLIKFFKNKNGGGVGSIDYLLNERVDSGTARILKGDENITRELINSMTQKHKICVGVLSFEEVDIDEDLKFEIMKSFENALLTDEMAERYNILWVEHLDKGRLELNFVIPKIDIETKKALNPYYYKADFARMDTWQNLNNLKYRFSDPKDPTKAQTLGGNHNSKRFNNYKNIDEHLHELVNDGYLNSRNELIAYIRENNIAEVTRAGENHISLKLSNSKKAKKFKGDIYENKFDFTRATTSFIAEAKERERRYLERDDERELGRMEQDLRESIERKAQFYRTKNARTEQKIDDEFREFETGRILFENLDNRIDADSGISNRNWRRVEVATASQNIRIEGENDDEFNEIRKRIAERKRKLDEADRELVKRQSNAIRYHSEASERKQRIDSEAQHIGRQIEYHSQRFQQRINETQQRFNKLRERIESFKNQCEQLIGRIRQAITRKQQRKQQQQNQKIQIQIQKTQTPKRTIVRQR